MAEETLRRQLQVLKRPCYRRTVQDLKTLVTSFCKVKFFKELEPAVKLQVCRSLKLDSLPGESIVFREGEPGDKFYIVLSGSVAVYIKDVAVDELASTEERRRSAESSGGGPQALATGAEELPAPAHAAQAPAAGHPAQAPGSAAAPPGPGGGEGPGAAGAEPALQRAASGGGAAAEQGAAAAGEGTGGGCGAEGAAGSAQPVHCSEGSLAEALPHKRSRLVLDSCRASGSAHAQRPSGVADTQHHLRLCRAEISAGHEDDATDWLRSSRVQHHAALAELAAAAHSHEHPAPAAERVGTSFASIAHIVTVAARARRGSVAIPRMGLSFNGAASIPMADGAASHLRVGPGAGRVGLSFGSATDATTAVARTGGGPPGPFAASQGMSQLKPPGHGEAAGPMAAADVALGRGSEAAAPGLVREISLRVRGAQGRSRGSEERRRGPTLKRLGSSRSKLHLGSDESRADSPELPDTSESSDASGSSASSSASSSSASRQPAAGDELLFMQAHFGPEDLSDMAQRMTDLEVRYSAAVRKAEEHRMGSLAQGSWADDLGEAEEEGPAERREERGEAQGPAPEGGASGGPARRPSVVQLWRSAAALVGRVDEDSGQEEHPEHQQPVSEHAAPDGTSAGPRRSHFASKERVASPLEGDELAAQRSPRRASQRRGSHGIERERSSQLQLVVLGVGDTFGEVALQTSQPRTATVRTREPSVFATLTRDDFTAILCTTVEQQRQERQDFLKGLPLFDSLQERAVRKLSALMQRRSLYRNERVFDFGAPVVHVFLARQGEFAVACRPSDVELVGADEAREELLELTAATAGGAPSAGAKAWLLADRRTEEEQRLERLNRDRFIIVALLTPPAIFGLSCYLRGEKRYRNRVVCQSTSGSVYTLVAKELVTHFSRERRGQLQAISRAEDLFYENRMMVLRRLEAPRERRRPGRRFWPQKKTLLERLEAARGEAVGPSSVYSLQGRLDTIGAAFREVKGLGLPPATGGRGGGEAPPAPRLPSAAASRAEPAAEGGEEGDAHNRLQLRPCWCLQETGGLVPDPSAPDSRAEAMQRRREDASVQAAMKSGVLHLPEDSRGSAAGMPPPPPSSTTAAKGARPLSRAAAMAAPWVAAAAGELASQSPAAAPPRQRSAPHGGAGVAVRAAGDQPAASARGAPHTPRSPNHLLPPVPRPASERPAGRGRLGAAGRPASRENKADAGVIMDHFPLAAATAEAAEDPEGTSMGTPLEAPAKAPAGGSGGGPGTASPAGRVAQSLFSEELVAAVAGAAAVGTVGTASTVGAAGCAADHLAWGKPKRSTPSPQPSRIPGVAADCLYHGRRPRAVAGAGSPLSSSPLPLPGPPLGSFAPWAALQA